MVFFMVLSFLAAGIAETSYNKSGLFSVKSLSLQPEI